MKMNFVTQEELIIERKPQKLYEWVMGKINSISQEENGKEAIRNRDGFCKQLMEELYPLSLFAIAKYGDRNDITLQPIIGNQNYDVLIKDYSFSPPSESKLEITLAHEGEKEHLRVLSLEEHRYAPLTGYIKKTGTKNKNPGNITDPYLGVRSLEEHINLIKDLIDEALKRKLKKQYEKNTSLLIICKKRIPKDYRDEIEKDINNFIETKLEIVKKHFLHLYFFLGNEYKCIFLEF